MLEGRMRSYHKTDYSAFIESLNSDVSVGLPKVSSRVAVAVM